MLRKPIVVGIILIFIMISLNPIVFSNIADKNICNEIEKLPHPFLISYNLYLDFQYDLSLLDYPIPLNQRINMPVKVVYWTDIPDFYLFLPWRIKNLILFGQCISPMIVFNLEVKNKPDWANIYFTSPRLLGGIPFDSDGKYEITTNLIIFLYDTAPAESYRINIKASSEGIGRLNDYTYQESIEFTPEFRPGIELSGFESIITPPLEEVEFPIHIKNTGNKISRITPQMGNIPLLWSPSFDTSSIVITVGDTVTVGLSVTAPNNFSGAKIFYVNFLVEIYPYRPDSPTGNYKYYFQLHYP